MKQHDGLIERHSPPRTTGVGRCVWCERPLAEIVFGICGDCIPAALDAVKSRIAGKRSA